MSSRQNWGSVPSAPRPLRERLLSLAFCGERWRLPRSDQQWFFPGLLPFFSAWFLPQVTRGDGEDRYHSHQGTGRQNEGPGELTRSSAWLESREKAELLGARTKASPGRAPQQPVLGPDRLPGISPHSRSQSSLSRQRCGVLQLWHLLRGHPCPRAQPWGSVAALTEQCRSCGCSALPVGLLTCKPPSRSSC